MAGTDESRSARELITDRRFGPYFFGNLFSDPPPAWACQGEEVAVQPVADVARSGRVGLQLRAHVEQAEEIEVGVHLDQEGRIIYGNPFGKLRLDVN